MRGPRLRSVWGQAVTLGAHHPVMLAPVTSGTRVTASLEAAAMRGGTAACAAGRGRAPNLRSRALTGHRGGEEPAASTAGLGPTADFHGRGLPHSPSTTGRMSAALASEPTLP